MDGAIVYFFSIYFNLIQILFFMSGEGLDNHFIHSDGLNIQISNIYAEKSNRKPVVIIENDICLPRRGSRQK